MGMNEYDYVDDSHLATQDEIDLGFTCEKCAENCGKATDGKIICDLDGKARDCNHICPQWK